MAESGSIVRAKHCCVRTSVMVIHLVVVKLYPSLSSSAYSGSNLGGSRLTRVFHMFLPPAMFQLLHGDPEVFLGQRGYVIPPVRSGPALVSPPRWMCPENLQRKGPRRHSNQTLDPPRLGLYNMKGQLLILYLRLSQTTLEEELIPANCIHDLTLSE